MPLLANPLLAAFDSCFSIQFVLMSLVWAFVSLFDCVPEYSPTLCLLYVFIVSLCNEIHGEIAQSTIAEYKQFDASQ